jgi:hypothetical protein
MLSRCLFITALFVASVADAYDPDRARNNFAHELANCAAYYTLTVQAPGFDEARKKQASDIGENLGALSSQLSSVKLAIARMELATKDMMRDLENRWENLSIVLNKYGFLCKEAAEDPEARLQYWLDKKD